MSKAMHQLFIMKNTTLFKKSILLLSLLSLLASCSYRPILDQNNKYLQVGEEAAQGSIDECTQKADAYLKQYKAKRAGKEAVRSGVTGAIFGTIFGLIFGNSTKAVMSGLAIGAGVGAASGAGSVAAEGTLKPDQIKQNYVSNCLARQGYLVIGWE